MRHTSITRVNNVCTVTILMNMVLILSNMGNIEMVQCPSSEQYNYGKSYIQFKYNVALIPNTELYT